MEHQNKNRRSLWIVLGGLGFLVFFSICGIVAAGSFLLIEMNDGGVASTTASQRIERSGPVPVATAVAVQPIQIPENVEDYETMVLNAIYQQVAPSVVNVQVLNRGSNFHQDQPFLFPLPEQDPDEETTPEIPEFQIDPDSLFPRGQGSGFVWDGEGHIVTNAHVVERADQVQVKFSDGTIAMAEVVGVDMHSDLAVLEIDPTGYTLVPVARGDLDEIQVGDRVAAIGNPFGFEGTLTSGIVSAIGRSIPALTSFSIPESIQTDAAINPGNSGGPLLNEEGEVIGVNAQIRVSDLSNTGIGFAIPITIVERVVPALIAQGEYEHSYIGVSGNTFSPICAEDLDLPSDVRGAYIIEVLPGTPAARAGLRGGSEPSGTTFVSICPDVKGGDLVVAIGDQPVTQFDDLLIYLERYTSPGDTVTLTVLRNGEERPIDVTLGARPKLLQ